MQPRNKELSVGSFATNTTGLSQGRGEVTGYWLRRWYSDCPADIRDQEPEAEQLLFSLYLQALLANLKVNVLKKYAITGTGNDNFSFF